MDFEFTVVVECPLDRGFAFFREVDRHAGEEGTVVPVYDKITPGPVRVGTRYREVVKVFPFASGEMISEVTHFEPGHCLGYQFSGLGMDGDLMYFLKEVAGSTEVVQRQSLQPRGLLKVFSPLLGRMFAAAAGHRLESIKGLLEGSIPD
jgi:hypothetical protein